MTHQWNPEQYRKFEKEREQPFFDLLTLLHSLPSSPRLVDLGCGSGKLTKILHDQWHASYTLGIDTSPNMLAKAQPLQTTQLVFQQQDIRHFTSQEPFDLVISNAALQWVPDHTELFKHFVQLLAPAGQLAIQMPANQDYPTHTLAAELAAEEPFKHLLSSTIPTDHVLSMEAYAQLLHQLGFESQVIRMQLYPHFLESTASIVEWVKGSLLTYYQTHLGPALYPQFLQEYQKRLIQRMGWSEPFFFPMKRLFIWGQLPQH